MNQIYIFNRTRFTLFTVGILALLAACTTTASPGPQFQPTQNVVSTSELPSPTLETTSPQPTLTESSSQPELTPTAGPAQAGIGPCDYLTKEEVAEVIGQKIVEAIPDDRPPACRYMTETDSSGYNGKVVVYVFTDPTAPGGFEAGKTQQDPNPQPVTGVGDDAYWSPTIDTLNVLYKNMYFMVQLLGVQNDSVDTAQTLALKFIDHLK